MTSTSTMVALGLRIHQTYRYTHQRRFKNQFDELGLSGMALVLGFGTALGRILLLLRHTGSARTMMGTVEISA